MSPSLTRNILGVPVYRWLILAGVGIGLLGMSVIIRGWLDIEWSIQSLRSFVESLGVWGPLAYIGILTFRFIFLIPTGLLLLTAGIVFGPAEGAVYAALGMTASGLLKYGFVSIIGREAPLRTLPLRLQDWVKDMSTKKVSTWALAGVSAYPFVPKYVFQLAAILSGMSFGAYAGAVLVGSFVRAAIFSNVGEAIYTGSGMITATGILLVSLILPMCIPSWRRWLFAPLISNSPPKL